MSSSEQWFTVTDFFLGEVNDKGSSQAGAATNVVEMDIFENKDFIQAEYGMSSAFNSDISPVYDFSVNKQDDDFWAYGDTYIEIGDFDPTGTTISGIFEKRSQPINDSNTARPNTEIAAYETSENSSLTTFTEWVYFTSGENGRLPTLERYNITDDDAPLTVQSDLGDTTTNEIQDPDAPVIMRIINGALYVMFANTITKIARDGTTTHTYEELQEGFNIVGATSAGRKTDSMFVVCEPIETTTNKSRGYWIDLVNNDVDNYLDLPYGGVQWVENIASDVLMSFVEDNQFRVMALSQPFPGSTAGRLPNIKLTNVLDTQFDVFDDSKTNGLGIKPSPSKSVHTLDGEIFFLLNKDDQPGIYSISRIGPDQNYGIRLAHKLPGSYPDQLGLAMGVYGNKKIVSYVDGYDGTAGSGSSTFAVVEPDDSNTERSNEGVYESVWFQFEEPTVDKDLKAVGVTTEPLPSNTEIRMYAAQDNESGYTQIYQADGSNMNETGTSYAEFRASSISEAKRVRFKMEIDGNGDDSPRVNAVGMLITSDNYPAHE